MNREKGGLLKNGLNLKQATDNIPILTAAPKQQETINHEQEIKLSAVNPPSPTEIRN